MFASSCFDWTTSSAAADGVGARRSATKSQMVKSVSWPTADITGILEAAIVRANDSSLKAKQVFERAAAACDHDDVNVAGAVEMLDAFADLAGSGFALHARVIDQNGDGFVPPPQDVEYVVQGRAAGRGHDANALGQRRNGLLARGVEQSFGGEPGLELFKGQLQGACSLGLQHFGLHLQVAALVVDGNAPARDYSEAVLRTEAQAAAPGHAT